MDFILTIDRALFRIINQSLSNPLFDQIMPLFDQTKYFIPLLLFPWLLTVFYDKKNRWRLAVLIPLVIILADQSGLLLKKTILRPRPFVDIDPELINHLVRPKGQHFSFPSNHAANTAGLATIFSSVYARYKTIFWSLAVLVMLSRIYIGVHYPGDVLAGCLLGTLSAIILIKGWNTIIFITDKNNSHKI